MRTLEMTREGLRRVLLKAHDTMSLATRRKGPPAKIELTPERRDRLKALGYLR